MDIDNKNWLEQRNNTPERLAIAHLVLDEVRQGKKVIEAIRRHPLPEGGYIAKQLLVAAYRQLIESGEASEDESLFSAHSYEASAHAFWRDHGNCVDQALPMSGKVYLLPYRRSYA